LSRGRVHRRERRWTRRAATEAVEATFFCEATPILSVLRPATAVGTIMTNEGHAMNRTKRRPKTAGATGIASTSRCYKPVVTTGQNRCVGRVAPISRSASEKHCSRACIYSRSWCRRSVARSVGLDCLSVDQGAALEQPTHPLGYFDFSANQHPP
jgi:hypothetical protein